MERGRSGGVYIISGRLEDNLRHAELMRTIAEVVREEQPGARIRDRFLTAPAWLVWMSALTAEAWSRLRGQPIALSRQVARVSRYALFYSYGLAEKELEYRPERTFREAVRLMCHSLRSEGTS
jgi:nucleoside-diphosphate-sugar epimerase